MRWIRKIVYGLGFRPRPGSIFFSPSWVLNAASRQAYAAFVKGYRECPGLPRTPGVTDDGQHCQHWYDDEAFACCRCGLGGE